MSIEQTNITEKLNNYPQNDWVPSSTELVVSSNCDKSVKLSCSQHKIILEDSEKKINIEEIPTNTHNVQVVHGIELSTLPEVGALQKKLNLITMKKIILN